MVTPKWSDFALGFRLGGQLVAEIFR